jgi:hypothetical protein
MSKKLETPTKNKEFQSRQSTPDEKPVNQINQVTLNQIAHSLSPEPERLL